MELLKLIFAPPTRKRLESQNIVKQYVFIVQSEASSAVCIEATSVFKCLGLKWCKKRFKLKLSEAVVKI